MPQSENSLEQVQEIASSLDRGERRHDPAQSQKHGSIIPANNGNSLVPNSTGLPRQGGTKSLIQTSMASLPTKLYGNYDTKTSEKVHKEQRRFNNSRPAAFSVKRSSRFEYMDPEEEEELHVGLRNLLSRRELEAIKEDAVNEVAMIIENINAELEDIESKSADLLSSISESKCLSVLFSRRYLMTDS